MHTRFIDIHTHVLPGVDDGAQTREEALQLVRMAWQDGTGALVLTPHYRPGFRKRTPAQLQSIFASFQADVQALCPGMNLYLGNEAAWEHDLPGKLAAGRVCPMHQTRYVLLEFLPKCLRTQALHAVWALLGEGWTPIIAHVERYAVFRNDHTLAEEVRASGALLQVNADSILGRRGFGIKQYCHRLLKEQKAHFIASDAHNDRHRPPLLSACFEHIQKKYGDDSARRLFWENAQKMLDDV